MSPESLQLASSRSLGWNFTQLMSESWADTRLSTKSNPSESSAVVGCFSE